MAKAIAVTKLGVVGGTVYNVGNYVLEATIADAVVAAGLATITQADVPDDIDLSTPEAILNAMGDTPSLVIVSASVTTKPSSPNEKDVYIVPAGSAWAALDEAYDNQLALFERGGWKYITPKFGWQVRNKADNGVLWYDGSGWTASGGGGSGTVTSVGLSLPNIFTISGSPVTTSGTLSATLANQSANQIFAGPSSGGAATPSFRSLVIADIPDISSVYATKAYADGLVVGLLDDRGNFDASSNTFPAAGGSGSGGAVLKGDLWTISVAGTLGGTAVTPGDIVRALVDTPGQTASNWAVSETNIGYTALNAALNSGQIYIGNGSNVGTARTFSGDVTVSNTGVTAIGAGKVTNAMLAGSIDLTAKVTGVLPFANGGTGLSALGSALQVLRVNAGGTALEFAAAGSGVVIGTTTITSGTNTRVLYNNGGVVGEYPVTGTAGNVVLSASPTLTGTVAMAAQTNSGTIVQTSASATAFESGPNGSTNPVFRLVNNTASQADGVSVTGLAAGNGVTFTALSSGSNAPINLATKGTGAINFNLGGGGVARVGPTDGANPGFEGLSAGVPIVRLNVFWGLSLVSDREVRWSNSSAALTTIDTNLSRLAAGTVRVGRGDAASTAGNLVVAANTASVGTSGFGVLVIGNGTAPTSSPADEFQLYSADSAAGDANAFARNEAGEINRLTGLSARVSTQFDKTSDTTLANVTGLSRNVEAGRTYAFIAVLYTTSNVAGGVKAAIGGTATATSIIYQADVLDGSTQATVGTARATSLGTTVGDVTAVTAARITITGTIVVNAAGTLTVQFAQNASNGTASSVLVNSSFQLIAVS